MPGLRSIAIAASLWALAASAPAQEPAQPAASLTIRSVAIIGAKELPEDTVRETLPFQIGVPTSEPLECIAEAVERRYHHEGYSFARVTPLFDEAAGALSLTIDEGVIDRVEFQGVVNPNLVRTFADEFALRAGDVFNRSRALQALEALLRQTRGAVRPGGLHSGTAVDGRHDGGTFDLIDRDGQHVLLVGLTEPNGRFRVVPDLGDREDWFTAVDGLVPSLGFGATVFDHRDFNHAYVLGHVSVRTATSRLGYALGFERPVFHSRKLYFGGEVHDLTATDDRWQVSPMEASLAAMAARRSFRDYYRRRGVQVNAAYRVHPQAELLFAWRGERQENLVVESDFSFWNGDEPFRSNLAVPDGRLNAILVGASLNAERFDRESLDASYRRHQLENPFGDRLSDPESRQASPLWRIDWTSEISSPGALDSDFDFSRHIVSARGRFPVSPHQDFEARVIGGWSGGSLPPQRQFAIGGIGSVHGYEFKATSGDTLALINLEYALGWRNSFQVLGFFDAGHVTERPIPLTAAAPADAPWLKGIGFGVAVGGARVDFGYKLDAIPSSLQVLLRFGRTF